MGAGIAYVQAKAGIETVLLDVSQESAEKGKAYSQRIVDKDVSRGKITKEKGEEILAAASSPLNGPDEIRGQLVSSDIPWPVVPSSTCTRSGPAGSGPALAQERKRARACGPFVCTREPGASDPDGA